MKDEYDFSKAQRRKFFRQDAVLARKARPLPQRIAAIAGDAARLGRARPCRAIKKREIDELWGNK